MSVSRPLAPERITRRRAASIIVTSSMLPIAAVSTAGATPARSNDISLEMAPRNAAGTAFGGVEAQLGTVTIGT